MIRYVIKRILLMPVTLLVTTLFIYVMVNLTPTDPALQMLPTYFTQEEYDAVVEEHGFDKPVLVQYANWIVNVFRGDFGTSWKTREPVFDEIVKRIPISLELSLLTNLVVLLLGMPLGVVCAVKQYSLLDTSTNILAKILGSIPNFWIAMQLMLLFSMRWNILPPAGFSSWKHWIMPVVTLALPGIAQYMRQARSAMLDCIRQDYLRTARSKGNKERTVIFRDALRNALLPMITMTGTQVATTMGNAIVAEKVFAIPGIGSKVVEAITNKDIPTVLMCTVILSTFFVLITLIIDVVYGFVDPRVKSAFLRPKTSKGAVMAKGAA